jgi:hypothetical protein
MTLRDRLHRHKPRHITVAATWYWPGCTYLESRTGGTWGCNGLIPARTREEGEALIRARLEAEADGARAAGDVFEWTLDVHEGPPSVSDVLRLG